MAFTSPIQLHVRARVEKSAQKNAIRAITLYQSRVAPVLPPEWRQRQEQAAQLRAVNLYLKGLAWRQRVERLYAESLAVRDALRPAA